MMKECALSVHITDWLVQSYFQPIRFDLLFIYIFLIILFILMEIFWCQGN